MTSTTALTHTFSTDQGDYTVAATSPVPGLFVYEIPDEVEPESIHRWSVGHHSGLLIASAMDEADALRGAHTIADLADWTKDVDALRAQVDRDEMRERIAKAFCVNRTRPRV
ncbi:hypothetical protein ACFC09_36310 [Streptomyces sp. NPDC056161]|uniref:hypothetical protein n=1 Tax=Streptomyces sp. NPDC056161 TaxID=3345732 RepID=UPI0035D84F81